MFKTDKIKIASGTPVAITHKPSGNTFAGFFEYVQTDEQGTSVVLLENASTHVHVAIENIQSITINF